MVKNMEMRLFIALILMFMPSCIWLLLREVFSPWWLENIISTPFIILVIYSVLFLTLSYFFPYLQSLSYCLSGALINCIFVILINNTHNVNNTYSLNREECIDPVNFFQFNIKYTEKEHELNELVEHLIVKKYHLITLQGVSQHIKTRLVEQLNSHYPYFITGENNHQLVHSDQLLFSRYAFSDIKYIKSGHSAFLITSQWQLPFAEISLHSLHPPSPRNEKLWQTRNKTLYQLKASLNDSLANSALVIGDLNLSKHSSRLRVLKQGMNTDFVNSWPNKRYISSLLGLAIDHFWVSEPAIVCSRQRINQFSWSDHYAVKTQVNFKK